MAPPLLPSGFEKSSGEFLSGLISFLGFLDSPSSEISMLSGSDDFWADLKEPGSASSKSPKSSLSAAAAGGGPLAVLATAGLVDMLMFPKALFIMVIGGVDVV